MNSGFLMPGVSLASINRDRKQIRWGDELVKPALRLTETRRLYDRVFASRHHVPTREQTNG